MSLVYLAGPISGQTYKGATEWREKVAFELYQSGISSASPLRFKSYLKGELDIADSYGNFPLSTPRAIYTRDRFDVLRSDVVLVNLVGADRVSIGSVIELGWADAFEKPVVIAMEDGNLHQHAMVNEIAGYVTTTLDDAVQIVRALLAPQVIPLLTSPHNQLGISY